MRRAAARRAFTLFEVLVALALMLILVAMMGSFLLNLMAARQRVIRHTEQQRAASIVIRRLETDLATCLVGDALHGAGIAGTTDELSVLTRSVPIAHASRGAADGLVLADLERAEYRFVRNARRVLARRQVPAAGGAAPGAGAHATVGEDVFLVRFRYHDGDGWVDEFDSLDRGRLPLAVEIAIWFDPWPGQEQAERGVGEADPYLDAPDEDFPRPEDDILELGPLDEQDAPRPDRVRVITVPDAADDAAVPPAAAGSAEAVP